MLSRSKIYVIELPDLATPAYVTEEITKAATSGKVDLTGYATVEQLKDKADKNHTHSEFEHTHSEFAAKAHSHSDYASVDHTHSDYVTATELNDYAQKTELENIYITKTDVADTLTSYYYTKTEVDALLTGVTETFAEQILKTDW